MLPGVPMNSTLSDSLTAPFFSGNRHPARSARFGLSCLFSPRCLVRPWPGSAGNLLLNGDLRAGTVIGRPTGPNTVGTARLANMATSTGRAANAGNRDRQGPISRVYWTQTVSLSQSGWYDLRAEVKTDNPALVRRSKLKVPIRRAARPKARRTGLHSKSTSRSPAETVQIGCGVRGMSAGRAFFRNLTLTDCGRAAERVPPNRSDPGARLPRLETKALLDVELAKAPADDSLLGDVVKLARDTGGAFRARNPDLDSTLWFGASSPEVLRLLRDRELRKSAGVAAFLCLSLLATWLVTRVEYLPGHGFYVETRHAVGGDEPHYLVMINSLLLKHDLQLQDGL